MGLYEIFIREGLGLQLVLNSLTSVYKDRINLNSKAHSHIYLVIL